MTVTLPTKIAHAVCIAWALSVAAIPAACLYVLLTSGTPYEVFLGVMFLVWITVTARA